MSSIQLVLLVCLIFLSQRGKGKLCAWSYSVLLWPEIPGILKSSKTDATIAVTEATATAEKPESHFRLSPTSSFPQLWEIKIFDKNRGGVASHFLFFFGRRVCASSVACLTPIKRLQMWKEEEGEEEGGGSKCVEKGRRKCWRLNEKR